MRLFAATFALLALAAAALAAGIDGKWVAKVPGRDGQEQEVTFTLKAKDNKLAGSVSNARGSLDISDGKIKGDDISFTLTMGEMRIVHTGKVSGDEIQFERKLEGGDRSQQFTAKKQ
jgi:hypothetical protein